MISVRKFWTIVILVIALSFSFLAYADAYLVKGDKVKDKEGKEYIIFKDEKRVQLGFKVDGINLLPIDKNKTDSLKKSKQTVQEKANKKENDAFSNNVNQFSINMLKFVMTFLGIFVTFIAVGMLGIVTYAIIYLWVVFKKY